MVDFARPAFLVLLAVLPWFWWHAQQARPPLRPRAVTFRIAIAAVLVLAAAGLRVSLGDGDMAVVYALDRSNSIDARAQERGVSLINAWAGSMRPQDRAGLVVFGADSALERPLSERLQVAEIASTISPAATNLAAALGTARAALQGSGSRRIVLISDGCETTGDALDEAAFAASDGVAVDVLRAGGTSRQMIRTTRVAAPEIVRQGEPFSVSVEIQGRPGGRGDVVITRDGSPVVEQPVLVGPDGTTAITFTDSHAAAGLRVYRASARDELDQAPDERTSARGAVVAVQGLPSVLFVTERQSMQSLLRAGGFEVTNVSPGAVPEAVDRLMPYDAVVLDDVASEQLTDRQASTLRRYVEDAGGGLLLLGSPHSLSAAGYPAGPLGEILPVDLRPRSGQRAPAMALAFVFDKSGSMADIVDGMPKIELARAAALKILDVVPATDSIGVIAFDAKPTVVAPLAAGHRPSDLAERLRSLSAGGATAIAPAVELAVGWLQGAPRAISKRHLLLLSDGRSPASEIDRLGSLLRGKGIELSVVAIGAGANRGALEELARSTGGRAFFPSDLRQLPLIVARQAARSAGGGSVDEVFTPRAQAHPALQSIDLSNLPALGGYVVSAGKPGSEPLLLSHLDDPVLSAWQAGLGKVAVFTSDLGSAWASELVAWNGAGRLWSQVVRWLHRRLDDEALSARLRETADGLRLIVESADPNGQFKSGMTVHAQVRPPESEPFTVPLEPTAPGIYEGRVPMGANGAYVVSITARSSDPAAVHRMLRGFYWTGERELRGCAGGAATLQRIAELTGGRLLDGPEGPFDGPRIASYRDLSGWLVALTFALFFLELTLPATRGLLQRGWRANARPDGSAGRQAA